MRLFNDWCHTCDHPSSADVAYGRFVMHLQQIGVLMGDDITERFFHIFTVMILACNCTRFVLQFSILEYLMFESNRNLLLNTLLSPIRLLLLVECLRSHHNNSKFHISQLILFRSL